MRNSTAATDLDSPRLRGRESGGGAIKRTAQFRRDFKRVKRSTHGSHIDETLLAALELLAADAPLPTRYVDHAMKGTFSDCRDCHLRPDLVLVYRKRGNDALELVRIGSHAQLRM